MIKLLDDMHLIDPIAKVQPYFGSLFYAAACPFINDPDLMSIWVECDDEGSSHSVLLAGTDSLIVCTDGTSIGPEMLFFITKIVEGGSIKDIDSDDVCYPVLKVLFPDAEQETAVQLVLKNRIDMPETDKEIKKSDNIKDVSSLMASAFGVKEKDDLDLWFLRMTRAVLRGQTTMLTLYENGAAVSTASIRGRTATAGAITSVVTLPEFRRKGYASCLTAMCSNMLIDEGREVWLVPADSGVRKMYEKLGFSYAKNYNCLHFNEKEEVK